MEKFRKLGIIEPILKSIQELKFEEPTEIQEKAIPLILDGKDIIAGASTGSGKTLAFASKIIEVVEKRKGIQALILTPTRELAEQVSVTFQRFAKYKDLVIMAVYGGVSINPQINKLRIADIVVGTPGRMLDHLKRRTIDLDRVKILVLDEADRMLDMGFKRDVGRIIDKCPRDRQTLLFSATISSEVVKLAKKYTINPIKVFAEAYVDPSKLKQIYYDVEDNLRFSLLVHLLKKESADLVMVFCNTQRNTDFVANNLKLAGVDALAIHGGHTQDKRSKTMQKFNSKHVSVLVCTDVAARGLDIKGVSHVYNYDTPWESNDYVHRIGRTARAGEAGKVINILVRKDHVNFKKIIRNEGMHIEKGELPKIERISCGFKNPPRRDFQRGPNKRFSRRGNGRPRSSNKSVGSRGSGNKGRGRHNSRGYKPRNSGGRSNRRNSEGGPSRKRNFNIDFRF